MLNKTDEELISSIKEQGDSDSFNEVCRRYENIFYKICQKYSPVLSMSGVNPQDIFDEKNYIIYHCVSTFKSNKKAKLSTWIGNYARYLCLNSINSRKFLIPSSDEDIKKFLEDKQCKEYYSSHSNCLHEDCDYVSNLLSQLKDQRVIDIFKLRYGEEKKMIWAKIAKKMNLSPQTVINLHNKGLKLIKRKFKSDNISDDV